MNLLEVENLRISLSLQGRSVEIVRGVNLNIEPGDFHAIVGESGCGKSLTAMALTRLPPTDQAICEGCVRFHGENLLTLRGRALRKHRGTGGIAYIFQDPMSALNPVLKVRMQLAEVLPQGMARRERHARMVDLLRRVDLPDERILDTYPCELSGGMAQRVCLAMAMASEPALLIADEPTTALDVVTQKNVLETLQQVCQESGAAVILITHHLGLVARHARRVSVMYAGRVVESGEVRDVLSSPQHPYTRGLLKAVPTLSGGGVEELMTIPGRVPSPGEWGCGCTFAPRCGVAQAICKVQDPVRVDIENGHCVWCHLNEKRSEKVS